MKGIGFGGKNLKQMLEENEGAYRETGYYSGLRKLELATRDPLKLEVFHSRLRAAVVAGREQARMISASPLVREVGELAVAVYTPEGDCVIQSTGIIIHIKVMGEVIKWMIKHHYEEEVGINEGDIFTSNDNMIAGLHSADFYDIVPIFWEGELVGWVATVIMENEIGGIAPGGVPSLATERFVEGIKFSAEKTGTNDQWFRFSEDRIRYNCRHPDHLLLDRKAALAADIKVREDIKALIAEVGIDYYRKAVRELIEAERLAQRERVRRRTVPGRLRSVGVFESYYSDMPVPPQHQMDYITFVPFDFLIKADGTYFWDFDGAGRWGWHPNNTSVSAMRDGASCLFLTQTIAYTGHANAGTLLCIDANCPPDTFVNPSTPFVGSGGFFSGPAVLGSLGIGLQSRAFFSRGFVEEVMAGSPSFLTFALAGKDQYGKDFGQGQSAAGGAEASGALAIRDGFVGYVIWLPTADMGNEEVFEIFLPIVSTGRRLLPDGCGWGKFRSGYPIIASYMVYKSPQVVVDLYAYGTNDRIYLNCGMFGGYPGINQFARMLVNSNTAQVIEQRKPLVHGITFPEKDEMTQNVTGKLLVETSTSRHFKGVAKAGDFLQFAYSGNAGGFGDPIKRHPTLAEKDLDSGLLSPERCRCIYCVEARYDEKTEEWVIDEQKTAELREKKRKERLAKGIPVRDWWQGRRQDIIAGKMPPLLKKAYNGSLEKGQTWAGEFRQFWDLPSDFAFKVEEV
jgi:acetone carboxylase, alpha subunit